MGVVAEIESKLAALRARGAAEGTQNLRTSTMTHIVWAPPEWLGRARTTLNGLAERHPSRTIFLVPEPGRKSEISARASLRDFDIEGLSCDVVSEVVEIRLRGAAAHHPGSVVLPLLISDLPAFCRWRGEPGWGTTAFSEIVEICDRLVVNSSEWHAPQRSYGALSGSFGRIAVSDIAFSRTLPWRIKLAALWPGIAKIERLRVQGPRADAELLAGWLRSRLRRPVALTRRDADEVEAVWVDGVQVDAIVPAAGASDLLSVELDQLGHDPVYEAAVLSAA